MFIINIKKSGLLFISTLVIQNSIAADGCNNTAASGNCGGVACVVRTPSCFHYRAGLSFPQIEEGTFSYTGSKIYPIYHKVVPNTSQVEFGKTTKWAASTLALGVGFWGSIGNNHCPIINGDTTYLGASTSPNYKSFNSNFYQASKLVGIPIDSDSNNELYRWTPAIPNGPISITTSNREIAKCSVTPSKYYGGSSFVLLNRGKDSPDGGIGIFTISSKKSGGYFRTLGPCGQGAKYTKTTSGFSCVPIGNTYGTGSYFNLFEDKGYQYTPESYASANPQVASYRSPSLIPFSSSSPNPKFVMTMVQTVHSSHTFKSCTARPKIAQVGQKNTLTFRNKNCPSNSICSVEILFWPFINRRECNANNIINDVYENPEEKFSKLRGDPVNGGNLFWTGYFMGPNLKSEIVKALAHSTKSTNDPNYFQCHNDQTTYYQDPAYLYRNKKTTEKCSSPSLPSSHYSVWSSTGAGSQVQYNRNSTIPHTGLNNSTMTVTITKEQFINLLYAQAALVLNFEKYNLATKMYQPGFPKCLPKTLGCSSNNRFSTTELENKILGPGKNFQNSNWISNWIVKKAGFGHEVINEGEDDGDSVFIGGNLKRLTLESF